MSTHSINNPDQTYIDKVILTFILQSEPYNTTAVNKKLHNKYRPYIKKDFMHLRTAVGLSSRGDTRYITTFIAFLNEGQEVTKGIYPVLQYSTDSKQVIIAYGVSCNEAPNIKWDWDKMGVDREPKKLKDFCFMDNEQKIDAQIKYGESYIYRHQDVSNFIKEYKDQNINDFSDTQINSIIRKYSFSFGRDLINVINEYKRLFEETTTLTIPIPSSTLETSVRDFSISKLIDSINKTNLIYSEDLIKRYVYSLLTKPFVILSGLSGSGKTQLALAVALALAENKDNQICFVSVGADWTNREPLLGYPNALKQGEYVRPESGVLQIMLEAQKNKNKPYFLILDEMNLSYVERYFSDFLSSMEAKGSKIKLWDNSQNDSTIPSCIELPRNLFITGTINVDETTYMFSPKVLDRSNVIEFKISLEDMREFLDSLPQVDVNECETAAKDMAESFVTIANTQQPFAKDIANILLEFFQPLKDANAEFGYRTATELSRFILLSQDDLGRDKAIDAAIVQKLLPKLHGNRRKIVPVLRKLWKLCTGNDDLETFEQTREVSEQIKYPLAADKILRMYHVATINGFTSFSEA